MSSNETRRAPVQRDCSYPRTGVWCDHKEGAREHQHGTVAWAEHVEAWTDYHKRHREQDAERIAERGGFGYAEITGHLGHEPTTWEPRT